MNLLKASTTVIQNGPLMDALMAVLLEDMANTYYAFVDNFGDSAYCAATTSDECFPEVPANANWTTLFSQPADDGTVNPFNKANCELWDFPNGIGGRYELLLNCIFVP